MQPSPNAYEALDELRLRNSQQCSDGRVSHEFLNPPPKSPFLDPLHPDNVPTCCNVPMLSHPDFPDSSSWPYSASSLQPEKYVTCGLNFAYCGPKDPSTYSETCLEEQDEFLASFPPDDFKLKYAAAMNAAAADACALVSSGNAADTMVWRLNDQSLSSYGSETPHEVEYSKVCSALVKSTDLKRRPHRVKPYDQGLNEDQALLGPEHRLTSLLKKNSQIRGAYSSILSSYPVAALKLPRTPTARAAIMLYPYPPLPPQCLPQLRHAHHQALFMEYVKIETDPVKIQLAHFIIEHCTRSIPEDLFRSDELPPDTRILKDYVEQIIYAVELFKEQAKFYQGHDPIPPDINEEYISKWLQQKQHLLKPLRILHHRRQQEQQNAAHRDSTYMNTRPRHYKNRRKIGVSLGEELDALGIPKAIHFENLTHAIANCGLVVQLPSHADQTTKKSALKSRASAHSNPRSLFNLLIAGRGDTRRSRLEMPWGEVVRIKYNRTLLGIPDFVVEALRSGSQTEMRSNAQQLIPKVCAVSLEDSPYGVEILLFYRGMPYNKRLVHRMQGGVTVDPVTFSSKQVYPTSGEKPAERSQSVSSSLYAASTASSLITVPCQSPSFSVGPSISASSTSNQYISYHPAENCDFPNASPLTSELFASNPPPLGEGSAVETSDRLLPASTSVSASLNDAYGPLPPPEFHGDPPSEPSAESQAQGPSCYQSRSSPEAALRYATQESPCPLPMSCMGSVDREFVAYNSSSEPARTAIPALSTAPQVDLDTPTVTSPHLPPAHSFGRSLGGVAGPCLGQNGDTTAGLGSISPEEEEVADPSLDMESLGTNTVLLRESKLNLVEEQPLAEESQLDASHVSLDMLKQENPTDSESEIMLMAALLLETPDLVQMDRNLSGSKPSHMTEAYTTAEHVHDDADLDARSSSESVFGPTLLTSSQPIPAIPRSCCFPLEMIEAASADKLEAFEAIQWAPSKALYL